jgi:hypothetical protein
MPDYKKLQRIFLLTGVLCTRVAKGGSAPGGEVGGWVPDQRYPLSEFPAMASVSLFLSP